MQSWRDVLVALASLPDRVYARWTMSSGPQFHFAIPKREWIGEDGFTEQVEFPFSFSEIKELYIFQRYGGITNNLEAIANALRGITDMKVEVADTEIVVRPPLG